MIETNKNDEKKNFDENKMRDVKIEKVVLSIGGTADKLEKGCKLLERITGRKAKKCKSAKRIPSLGVSPGLEVGCMVTLRKEKAVEVLKKLLSAIDNQLKEKQISENTVSFGMEEYIEIPGMSYQRDIGIMGFDVSVSFSRAGKRVEIRKIKRSKMSRKQIISKEEIIKFLTEKFGIEIR